MLDLRACEFRVKWNRKHLARGAFADSEIAWLTTEHRIQRLEMERNGIIDHACDAALSQPLLNYVAAGSHAGIIFRPATRCAA